MFPAYQVLGSDMLTSQQSYLNHLLTHGNSGLFLRHVHIALFQSLILQMETFVQRCSYINLLALRNLTLHRAPRCVSPFLYDLTWQASARFNFSYFLLTSIIFLLENMQSFSSLVCICLSMYRLITQPLPDVISLLPLQKGQQQHHSEQHEQQQQQQHTKKHEQQQHHTKKKHEQQQQHHMKEYDRSSATYALLFF
jgi:hypothetical protein